MEGSQLGVSPKPVFGHFFLLNDLELNLSSEVAKLAEDTQLFRMVKHKQTV